MKLGLLGYGKMGKEIEKVAMRLGYNIACIIDPGLKIIQDTSHVDVFIDFSIPNAVINNINLIGALGKNIVIGTTGWYEKLDEAKKLAKKYNVGIIYGENFSIGVNLFYKLIDFATKQFANLSNYDPYLIEEHHHFKKDSPSGTAKKLIATILSNIPRKKTIYDPSTNKAPLESELNVSVVRSGDIPGTHLIGFDSISDTIKLAHIARSREGFAEGALLGAKWILNKKGFYKYSDVFDQII
jgi:4-hydroxy-tetrahydrodipicolinate reductase